MKRTISIILSVMMILSSFVGVSAFAVTTETCSIEYVSSNNVTISNTDKTVKKGDSYVATITSNIVKNFDGMDVRAMMGDQIIYPQKITDESYKIIISKVTDDVKIIAKAYEKTADTTEVIGNSRYISISRNLVNCTSSGMNSSYCKFLSLLLLQEVFLLTDIQKLCLQMPFGSGRFFASLRRIGVRFGKVSVLLWQGVLRPLRRIFCGHAFYYIFCGQKMARLKEGIQN